MDKAQKQKYIAALQAVFTSITGDGISGYKLWPYVVGVSCGLNKRLVVDPKYKDRPIVSLYQFSGWDANTEYGNEGEWYNSAITDVIDLANEVNAFNIDTVNDVCYSVWSNRQAMVYPAALATMAKDMFDAAANAVLCSLPTTPKAFEKLNEKENQAVIIYSNRIGSIIEKMVQEFKEQAFKNENPVAES